MERTGYHIKDKVSIGKLRWLWVLFKELGEERVGNDIKKMNERNKQLSKKIKGNILPKLRERKKKKRKEKENIENMNWRWEREGKKYKFIVHNVTKKDVGFKSTYTQHLFLLFWVLIYIGQRPYGLSLHLKWGKWNKYTN